MFGMATRADEATVEAATTDREPVELTKLREDLVLPASTNLIKLAESNLRKLKADREELSAKIAVVRKILAKPQLGDPETRLDQDDLRRLQEQFEATGGAISAARAELQRRREEFSPTAREAVGPALDRYAAAVHRKLDELEELLRIAADLNAMAVLRGVEMQSLVGRTPLLLEQLYAMRRIMLPGGGF